MTRELAAIMQDAHNLQTRCASPESQKMPRLFHYFTRRPATAERKMIKRNVRRYVSAVADARPRRIGLNVAHCLDKQGLIAQRGILTELLFAPK